MENQQTQASPASFQRLAPSPAQGLTSQQVSQRMAAGAHNAAPKGITPTVGKIILKNVCTLFNLINFLLALAILLVGHPRNTLFFGVAVCNTAMGIFQELRAKRTLDKLSVLARGTVTAIRDGQQVAIAQEEVVLDDILYLATGGQACADAVVVETEALEMNESLLTGEADPIKKQIDDTVLSGSFAVAGHAYLRVTAVGNQSYAGTLAHAAKQEKRPTTPLMRTLNNIIRILAITIIPVGLLLFFTQYTGPGSLDASVLGTAAAMIGMIPEGLILLTGVTLTVGALRLARRKALVQTLPSIETLARADVLCLDKTGTITDGTLGFDRLVPQSNVNEETAAQALAELLAALGDDNPTANALRQVYPSQGNWQAEIRVPFSSARKWSGAQFAGQGSYILGAPGFVFANESAYPADAVAEYATQGYRVLCLAHSPAPFGADGVLPPGLSCAALLLLTDNIRPNAVQTFRFFEEEGVTLKVISGDDARTVSTIAGRAGITGADSYVDMSTISPDMDFIYLVDHYTVFGRVSPQQKQALIAALKRRGHTTCMTGDGVNDVLAMKEADCGIAMINGSEASRGAADFVLMTNDFSAMVDVLREGRLVINNIENVACLYLVKTIYSTLLSIIYVFLPYYYPFDPIQMTPINVFTVGIPSFFLALRPNFQKPEGRFALNILQHSLPGALIVVLNILIIQLAGHFFALTELEMGTMNVLLTGMVGFSILYRVASPLRKLEAALLGTLALCFLCIFFFFGDFFSLGSLFTRNAFFYGPLLYAGPHLYTVLSCLVQRIADARQHRRLVQQSAPPDSAV